MCDAPLRFSIFRHGIESSELPPDTSVIRSPKAIYQLSYISYASRFRAGWTV